MKRDDFEISESLDFDMRVRNDLVTLRIAIDESSSMEEIIDISEGVYQTIFRAALNGMETEDIEDALKIARQDI